MAASEHDDEEYERLARLLDLRDEDTDERVVLASNDARVVGAYVRTLLDHGLTEEAAVHLTCEWLQRTEQQIEWDTTHDDEQPGGDE